MSEMIGALLGLDAGYLWWLSPLGITCHLRIPDHGNIEVVNRERGWPWTCPYVQGTYPILAHGKATLLNESL